MTMTRQCGKCNLCCVLFSINDPPDEKSGFVGLTKAAGITCPHSTSKGCDIYDKKGPVCNKYKCLWINNFLPEWMKPDVIGIVFDRFRPFNGKIYMMGHLSKPLNMVETTIDRVIELQIPVYIVQKNKKKHIKNILYEPSGCCDKCRLRQKDIQEKMRAYMKAKNSSQ